MAKKSTDEGGQDAPPTPPPPEPTFEAQELLDNYSEFVGTDHSRNFVETALRYGGVDDYSQRLTVNQFKKYVGDYVKVGR